MCEELLAEIARSCVWREVFRPRRASKILIGYGLSCVLRDALCRRSMFKVAVEYGLSCVWREVLCQRRVFEIVGRVWLVLPSAWGLLPTSRVQSRYWVWLALRLT